MWSHPSLGNWVRYVVLGGFNVCLIFGLTVGSHELLGFSERVAGGIALVSAYIINFLTARYIVFATSGSWRRQFMRFIITSSSFRLGEYLVFVFLTGVIGVYYLLALAVTLAASFILKFAIYKTWVFGATGPKGDAG